ncbi:AraC family transcriptional regulator [Marinibactrum halimedae]|uniref:AraC family transcriptional regulator n=1 Tax=Marinibactrum halimedae TaxID=1444977 RepID=A0AA37T3R5_9GAMM|nr:AraC family transcriptional regulator [Marinibactrum halimedae]MCD9457666.1 AraC family transcriptional regulator [Marinibactrum halimedae]GLS24961.1 AraC family transcriptional regulator [Marinibactrum halimedae]
MKRATKFSVEPNWAILLQDMKIDPVEALTHAGLPEDLIHRENASLLPKEFFRLWRGFEAAADGREVALLIAQHLTVESFSPPLFASICSSNLNEALLRIKEYKPLIGPMDLHVDITSDFTQLSIECYGSDEPIPHSLSMAELVFFTQLARIATRANINPAYISLPVVPRNPEPYREYFGCDIVQGDSLSIRFSAEDAQRTFLTKNAGMWNFFEEKLKVKLKDLNTVSTTSDRVRAVLVESLPRGESSIEFVSDKLAMSKRTLQRKLAKEDESYQGLLQSIRTDLADHYLMKSTLPLGEISFLLGFQEPNSFVRAYSSWTGVTPGKFRQFQKSNGHSQVAVN